MPKTTLDLNVTDPGIRRTRNWVNGVLTNDTETFHTRSTRVESRVTTNTPGYRNSKGKPREDLPMNPFDYHLDYVEYPYGVKDSVGPVYRDRQDGLITAGTNFEPRGISSADRTRTDDEALLASLLDLKNQKVNLGVTLVEGRETVGLILDTAKRLGGSYRAFRKGDFRGGFAALGSSPGATDRQIARLVKAKKGRPSASAEVLAVQLGWRPMLGDIYSYAEYLAYLQEKPQRIRVTTSRTHRWSGPFGDGDTWEGVPAGRFEQGRYTRKYTYVFSRVPSVVHDLAQIGVTNPLSWLWELTTLSFVVDWFLRVGDFIDALDATVGLEFEKGCTTTFEKWSVRYRARGSAVSGSQDVFVAGTALRRHVECVRTPLTGFPGVPPIMFGSGLGWSRSLTAGALLRQFFKR